MNSNIDLEQGKVLVVGLGQIGCSNAEFMRSRGLRVEGYDLNSVAMDHALESGAIQSKATSFSGYDYYIVCISTNGFTDIFSPKLDGIFEIAMKIQREGKPGALVGIDSTVTRGTSRKVSEILGHRQHVVHVPHRFYMNEKETHGVHQTRVMGGYEQCCIELGTIFYEKVLGIPLVHVSSIELAELSKIVENASRYVEIAFAEEVKMACDSSGINFDELRNAVNTKWNVKVLEARQGIGGHCLPKDSEMFLSFARKARESSVVEAAKLVDIRYRLHLTKNMEMGQCSHY